MGNTKIVMVRFHTTKKEERRNLLSTIYNRFKGKEEVARSETVTIEGYDYNFVSIEEVERFKSMYHKYIYADHSEIFLEEPEDNLFPPTQCKFVNWLLDAIKGIMTCCLLLLIVHMF